MTYLSEKQVRAVRKRHLCEACDKHIEIGEPATNWCGTNDGGFCNVYYHPDCRQAEIAFNHEVGGYMDPDDWRRLCEAESEDLPWIKANWPAPYLRMCMTREQWSAQGIAARSDETALAGSAVGQSPVGPADAPQDNPPDHRDDGEPE